MGGALGLVVVIALAVIGLWLVALIETITGGHGLDPAGRLILGLLLILVPPLGVLVWIGVRLHLSGHSARASVAAVLSLAAVPLVAGVLAITQLSGVGGAPAVGGASVGGSVPVQVPAQHPAP
jgi:hypothetical protein